MPLLNREQEAHLFRKMNFLKYRAKQLRDQLDPKRARTADIERIEELLNQAAQVKSLLISCNMRLVVVDCQEAFGPGRQLLRAVVRR
ncbi:MAG: hypothetical protein KatS3mg105_0099 [Gemmatales bacterium]|nr:MAG: hypothetical protein KatS3mg105_0099 [Gemmatales bacterium]